MPPLSDVRSAVEQRLADYFDQLGTVLWDSRQRHCFASYAIGLMSELERKSLEPIADSLTDDPKTAERLHHRLQNFVADAPWPDAQVRLIAARHALTAMQKRAPIQTWICDDTSFPKSGHHSVGVQRQYCGALGKVANCQVAPSLVVATAYAHVPIDMTLYLGPDWADDPARRAEARIPEHVEFKTKPELMLALIERARKDGIPPGIVLGDSAFGDNRAFRHGVRVLLLPSALSALSGAASQERSGFVLGLSFGAQAVGFWLGGLLGAKWGQWSQPTFFAVLTAVGLGTAAAMRAGTLLLRRSGR